jgi:hypothetical protein
MIRRFIKPAYSHAPWKNPKYPPSCMCNEKTSPANVLGAKVLGSEATTADKAEKGKALMVVPSIAQRWNTFPLIAGFTTFILLLT